MTERWLTFARAGRSFALPAAEIAGIAIDRPAEPVPLAPSAVAGLVLERGRLLTVIDLDRLLRIRAPADAGPFLVALAPPFAHIALRIAAELHLEAPGERAIAPERIEVGRLLEAVEAVSTRAGRATPQGGS